VQRRNCHFSADVGASEHEKWCCPVGVVVVLPVVSDWAPSVLWGVSSFPPTCCWPSCREGGGARGLPPARYAGAGEKRREGGLCAGPAVTDASSTNPTNSGSTETRAPNGPPKARHEAGYRSPICLNKRRNTNLARETRTLCGANRFEPMGMTSEVLGEVLPIPPRDAPSPM
jgi:hypothetical protein